MKKRLFVILSTFVLFLTLCFPTSVYAKNKERVIACSKSVAETWVLAGGQLVGATEDATDYADTSIGSITKPSLEQIQSLEPTLVLVTEDIPSHKSLKKSLEDLGIDVYVVDINSFSDYKKVMKDFTKKTNQDDLYKKNVTKVEKRIKKIKKKANKQDAETASYLLMRLSASKNKVIKGDHFVTEMLNDMKMENVADDTSSLDQLNMEAILEQDPDYIFITIQGDIDQGKDIYENQFQSNPTWSQLKAIQNNHVVFLEKDYFQYKPNNHWDKAYETVYSIRFEE